MKVLRDKASAKDSSDFIKEVQTMIDLESKQQCMYIIKLRGVAKGMLNLICRVALINVLYNVHDHFVSYISSGRLLLAKLLTLTRSRGQEEKGTLGMRLSNAILHSKCQPPGHITASYSNYKRVHNQSERALCDTNSINIDSQQLATPCAVTVYPLNVLIDKVLRRA